MAQGYYPPEGIEQMKREFELVPAKARELRELFVLLSHEDEGVLESTRYGFARRVKVLAQAISNVFYFLPPDIDEIPDEESRINAEINLQAFIINLYGCLDNIAKIWVGIKGVTKENGSALHRNSIGLYKTHDHVRNSFSDDFRAYLEDTDEWLEYVKDYRDALAHRIGLYIPPFYISPEDEVLYQRIENEKISALRRHDIDGHQYLTERQDALRFFKPVMKHSFLDDSSLIPFHAQMLSDFNTIEELAKKFMQELGGSVTIE